MARKITKKDWFIEIMAVVEMAEIEDEKKEGIKNFINHEIALLNKKHSSTGVSKVQKEQEAVMNQILEELTEINKPVTVTELMKRPAMENFSNQKLSAMLKKLVETEKVVKVIEKKKSYFSIPGAEPREEEVKTAE